MFMKNVHFGIALALGLTVSSTAALAQKTESADGGQSRVKLSASLVGALSSLGVKLGTVEPSSYSIRIAHFPIVSGAIDLDTAKGQILHSGGLTLAAGKTFVKLQSFIIDTTGSAPVLTGIVVANGKLVGRIPLLDIQLPSGIKLPLKPGDGVILSIYGSNFTLTTEAADALNAAFSVSAFKQGFDFGKGDILALLAGPEDLQN